ncbi:HAT dimerization, partial [Trametes versicolor FP-101664 SS1]|uniref:HAT dimerization n=1 Tax=Trametes versicolor (strain FP-101664) TaxID=717944 RepID=UPI0004623AF7
DELKRYLASDPVPVTNPIQWWQDRRKAYPRLSRMAIDYLTIPTTAVDVERVFSRGRVLLSHVRNRMTTETTRAAMCLGIWSEHDLIDIGDLKAVTAQ